MPQQPLNTRNEGRNSAGFRTELQRPPALGTEVAGKRI
jgi:hypothetical protein